MRHLILALMITLLPVRGWVGEVMATEMAAPRAAQLQIATEMIAYHAHAQRANTPIYHREQHEQQAAVPLQALADFTGHGAGDNTSTNGHGDSCSACQACHTLALSPVATDAAPVWKPFAPPRSLVAHFASANTALGQKPPIS